MRDFLDWLEPAAWPEIDAAAVRGYLARLKAELGRSSKTLRNVKSHLSGFCDFLKESGHIERNPCRDVICRKEDTVPPPTIQSQARLGKFLLSIGHRETRHAVMLDVAVGPRLEELCLLRWDDIAADQGTLLIRKAKGKRPRIVPLCRMARIALRAQHRISGHLHYVFPARHTFTGGQKLLDRPCSVQAMSDRLRAAKQGWPEFEALPGKSVGRGWHLLRHTFASQLAEHNVNLVKIQRWMGHSDIKQTERYIHLRQEYDPDIESIMRKEQR